MKITLHCKFSFHLVLYHSDDGSCSCSNMSVLKLKSVVIFVKLMYQHSERLKNSMADIEVRFSLGGNFRNISNNTS